MRWPWFPETVTKGSRGIAIVSSDGRPWLRVPCGNRHLNLYAGNESHAIKVINLRSNVIPAPLDLRALHIDKVDRADMFGWHNNTILRMNRQSLPDLITIQMVSECMDPSRLANHQDLTFTALSDQKRVQLPELQQIAEICNLAELWTQGILRPYQKIEAICQQLRENYTLDRSARVPDDCEFPVGHFLFESKRGPDYQFATAATLMLRSLGFSTRLVSGFYADPKRHDPRKQQTAVHSSDVHFWCEVYVGAETWVTLDPTPGYEVLSSPPGLLKRVTMLMLATAQRIMKHWVIASIILYTLSAAVVKRRMVADRCNLVLWRFALQKPHEAACYKQRDCSIID